jgi:predicted permease
MAATPSLFRLLRVAPAYGRAFLEREGEAGNERAVIMSHGLWQEAFGGDPGIVGRAVRLSGRPFTVVGIMPPDFTFGGADTRFWIPLVFADRQKTDDARHSNGLFDIGRLKPGATLAQAREELRAIDAANMARLPAWRAALANAGYEASAEPLQDVLVRGSKVRLQLLWGGAIFVLLIGVVNLANLAIVRSTLRIKDLATRLAIGAGRAQIIRRMLIEGVVLSGVSGLAGLGLAWWILSAVTAIGWAPQGDVRMDGTVIALALALVAGIGVLIGGVSSLPLFTLQISTALQEESRGGTSSRKVRTVRRAMIVAQVACSFVLLMGAGLLLATFRNVLAVDRGFTTAGVVTASMSLPSPRYATADQMRTFVARARDAIRGVATVASVGVTSVPPLSGNYQSGIIIAEGYVPTPGESLVSALRAMVTPGYFEAVGTPLVRGRFFEAGDDVPASRAIIVDERLARRFWPDGDAIGRRMFRPRNANDLLTIDGSAAWLTVVGVVREARLRGLSDADRLGGTYYLPYATAPPREAAFVIRTEQEPDAVIRGVRSAVAAIDPELPLFDIRTLAERTERSLMPRKSVMVIAVCFAGVGMFLSALGIYGVLAHLVAQRRREMGIRLVMGSTPRGLFGLVFREGLLLVALGVLLGLGGALALRDVLAGQLYGIAPTDVRVIAAAVALLAVVALAACVTPARRATRVDPLGVLNAR